VHASRFEAVVRVVEGITLSQRASVTSIGRARPGRQKARHGIKAVDRLLSNAKLQREQVVWYAALAKKLIRCERRVLVLLDWTQLQGDVWALVAAVPFRGRSLPLLAKSYDKSEVGSREVHVEFLRELRGILPEGCTPVIVADGGFRSPFFVACEAEHMKFVVRLRNERAKLQADHRLSFGQAFDLASDAPKCLGEARPYASSQLSMSMRVVLGPRPANFHRRRSAQDYERKRAAEPWLLGTNLENEAASSIVEIYAHRMQIEECFRDAKCPRFGWALRFAMTKSLERFDVMLLLVSLAFACIMLIGAAAVEAGVERGLRASSSQRRVLSLFAVGCLVAKSRILSQIRLQSAYKHLKALRAVSRALFPRITPPRSENRNVSLPLPHGLFCVNCGWHGAEHGWPP
jgi:hypothetical protein